MVAYNRRMGNGVPTIMDYAAPYINLAFTLKDREKEEEDRALQKEQLKLENEWKAKQIGFQENANTIAMDTNKLNRERFESDKSQREIENASKPANQRPLSKELVTNLVSEMNKKDSETGIKLYGAYAEPMKTLIDSAGTKTALESYYDFSGSLASNMDSIISSLQQEKAKAGNDPQKIQAIDKAIADVSAGGKQMLAKFFPGIHTMVQSDKAKAEQERMDKLTEKDVEGNKARRNTMLNGLKTEYEELSKAMTPWYTGEKDQVSGQPIMDNEKRNRIFRRMNDIKKEIMSIESQGIGGSPDTNAQVPAPVVNQSQRVGGNGIESLIPASGPAINNVPVMASGPRMTQGITQPPSVEDDATYIAGLVSTATKKGADGKNLPAIKALIDDFTARHPDKESQTRFMQAIELAESGISEEDILPVMVNMRMSRPQAIEYLKSKVTDKKRNKKEGSDIGRNLGKNLTEIGGNIKKGVRGILDEE